MKTFPLFYLHRYSPDFVYLYQNLYILLHRWHSGFFLQIYNTRLLMKHWSIDFLYITYILNYWEIIFMFILLKYISWIFNSQIQVLFFKYQRPHQSFLETYFCKTVYCLSSNSHYGISPDRGLNGGWIASE